MSRHLAVLTAAIAVVAAACGGGSADENPLAGLSTGGDGAATYVAFFDGLPDLSTAADTADWGERGQRTVDALQQQSAASQADALELADEAGIEATSWWVANALSVDGSQELGTALESLPGVTAVVELSEGAPVSFAPSPVAPADVGDPPWAVSAVGADQVWAGGVTGENVVVATIDTGVAADHPALAGAQREDRSWWDTTGTCPDAPCDDVGHGTATMGLLVAGGDGQPRVGLAPDATWLAAKACDGSGCDLTDLWSATQFLLAPTDPAGADPDPSARPHVVNLSLELPPGLTGLEGVVEAFTASGIFAFFAGGDAGPGCTTVGSPGEQADAFAVGATDTSGQIDAQSSRGPGADGAVKPDVVAPGVDVVSTGTDGGYVDVSGSSMAAPVAAGVAALALAADPSLIGDPDLFERLRSTAEPVPTDACSSSGVPNNTYGAGLVDAAALLAASGP